MPGRDCTNTPIGEASQARRRRFLFVDNERASKPKAAESSALLVVGSSASYTLHKRLKAACYPADGRSGSKKPETFGAALRRRERLADTLRQRVGSFERVSFMGNVAYVDPFVFCAGKSWRPGPLGNAPVAARPAGDIFRADNPPGLGQARTFKSAARRGLSLI